MVNKNTLTRRQIELLEKFYKESKAIEVHTVEKTQYEIASELKVTRQALSSYLRTLKELGFIRTGRGFVDLTEKALKLLDKKKEVFILVKIEPTKRREVYEAIRRFKVKHVYRVTGDVDLIIKVDNGRLDEILEKISSLKGVKETTTYVIFETLELSEEK